MHRETAATVPAEPQAVRAGLPLLAAVGLVSATGLMFEVTLTRIFSATIWYHFAFVAISVALFGWGLGGFLVHVLRPARFATHVRSLLIGFSLLLSLTLPLFMFGILQYPFTRDRLSFYFGLGLLPFLAGGATLSLAFESHGRDSNRLYGADLIGAALGTLMVPAAIGWLGAETAVLAMAVLPAIAAVVLSLFSPRRGARRWAPVASLFLLGSVGLAAWNWRSGFLSVRDAPEKELYQLLARHPGRAHVETDRWNAYSRITSVRSFDESYLARIFIDSSAETNVLHWNGTPADPPSAPDWFRAFPFRLVPEPRVLVIGPGGGTDVVMAIAAGSPAVTAVEMNPLIVECVRGLGQQAGHLYDHSKVHLIIDEGRSFIERTSQHFDLIVLGWVDSWASVASGGLALTENYLYTSDAMTAYYDRLTPQGALAIIRWPVDVPRLVANAVASLSGRGMEIGEIGRHIMAVSSRPPGPEEFSTVETVFLLTRLPMTPRSVETLLKGHDGVCIWHAPFRGSKPPYDDLFTGRISFERFTDSFDKMASPVADDHPFYFARDKPVGIPDFVIRLLRLPVGAVLAFTVLLLAAGRYLGVRTPSGRTITYFGALGMGFIVIEVALLQRLILLLGHPLYTLVVILFALLLAGGLGSLFARRFAPAKVHRALGRIIPLVILLTMLAAFALPAVVRAALPLGLPARILAAGALVFPYGFLMGMPFPLGLRASAQNPRGAPVSALWGINGVASVVGSIAGMALAVAAGFTWVFMAGAACYAVAWAARPR